LPVVKKKGPAQAGVANHTPAVINANTKFTRNLMSLLLIDVLVWNHQLHTFSIRSRIRRDPRLHRLTIDMPGRHALPFT
jgi:hypothetical protein